MNASRRIAGCVAAVVVILAANVAESTTITVDTVQKYQTIDGIGTFTSFPTLYRPAGVFWVQRPTAYDESRMAIDLGASMARFELSPSCYPVEGGPYNWATTDDVFGVGTIANMFRTIRVIAANGCDHVIFSVWSPPCWMKADGKCGEHALSSNNDSTNYLLPRYYGAMAQYIADFCKTVKDSTGVEPWAVSCQNEPGFSTPYNSCWYNGAQLDSLVSLTGPRLAAAGLHTRIFGAEFMDWDMGGWTAVIRDPATYAFAVHGYDSSTARGNDAMWANLHTTAGSKRLWMTEHGGLMPQYGFQTARALHSALQAGNLSAWDWWTWDYESSLGNYTQTSGHNTSWTPNDHYYATKHYARFVRPGAVRVGCTLSDTAVLATAYRNADNSYAVVLFNNSATATATATVTGTGLPATWNKYQTTGSDKCKLSGTTDGAAMSLAAGAMVTLFSGAPVPELGADTTQNSLTAPPEDNTVGRLNVFGDDYLAGVWLNGAPIPLSTALGDTDRHHVDHVVSLRQGDNILACKLENSGGGGALVASMLLPGNDTLRTDTTWKVTLRNPEADPNWLQSSYDDSKWSTPGEAEAVQDGPGFVPGTPLWSIMLVNQYYQKAHWIVEPRTIYFRKEMTLAGGTGTIALRGNNFNYKIYVNGSLVRQGTEFSACSTGQQYACLNSPITPVSATFTAGTNTIALEIQQARLDGSGVLLKTLLRQGSGGAKQMIDSTWKCWSEGPAGWNATGFVDTGWVKPVPIGFYDPVGTAGTWMYPGEFWFRKTFTSTAATVSGRSAPKFTGRNAVVSVKYFNVQGRMLKADPKIIATSNALLIQRTIYRSGQIEDAKVLRMR